MAYFERDERDALHQLLTTIMTSKGNTEMKQLIHNHNLISAIYRDPSEELIRQDIKNVIMSYNIQDIDIHSNSEIIQNIVDHIIEDYDYSDYNNYIAEIINNLKCNKIM